MRFEESIFKAASNLDDYRKTIQKRIKRLQKHYAKQQKAEGSGGDNNKSTETAESIREKELLFEAELREKYAKKLMYIAKHANQAIAHALEKNGEHKADVLKQHANNAKMWAVHLGLELPIAEDNEVYKRQKVRDMPFLKKLSTYLETRVDNIHSHVIKMSDPDLFLQDALLKIDDVLLKNMVSETYQKAMMKAAPNHLEEFNKNEMDQLMERVVNVPIPIPRRNIEGDQVRAAVARIEKVRAAAQALYTYMGLSLADKTSYRGCVKKCHSVVMDCLKELESEYDNLVQELDDKDADGKRIIQLEDAWNNPMTISSDEDVEDSINNSDDDEPATKRQKLLEKKSSKATIVIRSRYLLTPGRNTLSTLLPVLKRKKALLVRNGSATYVKLEFGKAFEMTIFFVPLLVTVRAIPTADERSSTSMSLGGITWPSLYQGLCHSDMDNNGKKSNSLSVLGVTGSYETIGPIIAKKLEYASSQATYVLRRCFAETTTGKSAMAKSEFEIEILEAGALIKFLQKARSTYNPYWVDVDDNDTKTGYI